MDVPFPTPVSTVVITEPINPCVQNLTGKPSSVTTTLGVTIVVAALIIALAVLATIINITVLILKNRRAKYSPKNLAKRYVAFKYSCRVVFTALLTEVVQLRLKEVLCRQPAMKPMKT